MGHDLDERVIIRRKDLKEVLVHGRILWEESDSFGFEIDFYNTPATMTCYYDVWEIYKKYDT